MKNFFKVIGAWCKTHIWQSVVIGVAVVGVVATSITLPIVLSNKDNPVEPVTKTYNVSTETVTGGTINLNKFGEVQEGTAITVTAIPNENFVLSEITINGNTKSTTSPFNFTVSKELADDKGKIVVGATFIATADYYKVANQEEWTAAFGPSKTFFMADNCKIELESSGDSMPTSNTTFIIDGNKMEEIENGQSTYACYEDGTYYSYSILKPQNVWTRNATTKNIVQAEITRFFESFAEMSVFTYDETTHTYVAKNTTIQGTYFEEAKVNFENGKLMSVYGKVVEEPSPSMKFTMMLDGTITYGGQSVTLPEIDPQPVYGYQVGGGEIIPLDIHVENDVISATTTATITKDEVYTFYKDNVKMTNITIKEGDNNFSAGQEEGTFVVHNDYTSEFGYPTIVLEGNDTNGFSLFGNGYEVPAKVTVTFCLDYVLDYGEAIYMVGGFCDWKPSKGIMGECEGSTWTFVFTEDAGTTIYFNFVINSETKPVDEGQNVKWENEPARSYTFTEDDTVTLTWQD